MAREPEASSRPFPAFHSLPLGPRGTSMMSVTFRKNIDPCCGTEAWIAPDSTYLYRVHHGYHAHETVLRSPSSGRPVITPHHVPKKAVSSSRGNTQRSEQSSTLARAAEQLPDLSRSRRQTSRRRAPRRARKPPTRRPYGAQGTRRFCFARISLQQLCVFRLHQTGSDASHERPES